MVDSSAGERSEVHHRGISAVKLLCGIGAIIARCMTHTTIAHDPIFSRELPCLRRVVWELPTARTEREALVTGVAGVDAYSRPDSLKHVGSCYPHRL